MTNTAALPAPADLSSVLGGPMGAHFYPAASPEAAAEMVPAVRVAEAARLMGSPLVSRHVFDGAVTWGVFCSLAP